MTEPARIEIHLETLAVDGITGQEAAALVAAAESELNAYYAGDVERGQTATAGTTAGALAATLAAAIREGRAT